MRPIRKMYGCGGCKNVATKGVTASDGSKFGQSPRPFSFALTLARGATENVPFPQSVGAKEGRIVVIMKYVYLLESLSNPGKHYTGLSADFRERLKQHNAGQFPHTAKHRPWKPVVVIRFENDARVEAFERYLKSGSGHAFAAKHFW